MFFTIFSDYISFVKRVIMLVKQYSSIQKLELIMRILVTGEDDDGVVMNKTLYKSRVTKTTVTTTKTSFSGPGVGQDDHIRLADGTLIDTHGTVVGNGKDIKYIIFLSLDRLILNFSGFIIK